MVQVSVYQLPSGKWRASVTIGHAKHGSTRVFEKKREAQKWERKKKLETDRKEGVKTTSCKVGTAFEQWYKIRESEVAASTLSTDRGLIKNHVTKVFRDKSLSDIKTVDVQTLFGGIGKDHVPTKKRLKITLGAFFTWCVTTGYIGSNPVRAVKIPKGSKPEEEAEILSWDQVEKMQAEVANLSNPLYAEIILVLAYSGLRWGELRAFRVGDIKRGRSNEGSKWYFHVRRSQSESFEEKGTKSGRSRRVPVLDRILPIIKKHLKGKKSSDYLFLSPRGCQLHKGNFRRGAHWDEVSKDTRLHDLRHTAATEWKNHGIDIRMIQQWLGHASITTTQIYLAAGESKEVLRAIRMINAESRRRVR